MSTVRTPFIESDLNVLSKHNSVKVCIGSGPVQMIRVIQGVLHAQIVFCWFASVYAAVAVLTATLLKKKSIIVVGGVDVAREREFNYGLWLSPWKSTLVGAALKRADRVLVVDQSLRDEILARVEYDGKNLEILPTGYDPDFWQPSGPREPVVLTVADARNEARLKVKGIDILFDVARRLPRVRFMLVGHDTSRFKELVAPANLVLHAPVDQATLLEYYQGSKVYCQPSRREGLSNTLCESMLCGCIPAATDVGGSGRAIGDCGILVPAGDPRALAKAIERALAMPESAGSKARDRIVALFPRKQREKRLSELIAEMSR